MKTQKYTGKTAKRIAIAAAAIVVLCAGCGGGGGGTASAPATPDTAATLIQAQNDTGIITGTLEDLAAAGRAAARSTGRTPLSGAKVYACSANAPASEQKPDKSKPHATTDADGNFTITGVPLGSYVLVVDADDDGAADDTVKDVSVEKGKVSSVGPVKVKCQNTNQPPAQQEQPAPATEPAPAPAPSPAPEQENHQDQTAGQTTDESACDLTLDKVIYATGETLVMTVSGYNPGPAPVKCGVKVTLRKWKTKPVQWTTNFNNADEYVVIPANSNGGGTIRKVIPETWALTNTRNASDYRVYTIHENGEVWGKGDNFNILKKKECKSKKGCTVQDGDDDDDDDTTTGGDTGGSTGGDTGGTTGGDTGGTTGGDTGTGGTTGGDTGTTTPPPPACTIACSTDAQCDDGIAFTVDSCQNPGTCDSMCLNTDF